MFITIFCRLLYPLNHCRFFQVLHNKDLPRSTKSNHSHHLEASPHHLLILDNLLHSEIKAPRILRTFSALFPQLLHRQSLSMHSLKALTSRPMQFRMARTNSLHFHHSLRYQVRSQLLFHSVV